MVQQNLLSALIPYIKWDLNVAGKVVLDCRWLATSTTEPFPVLFSYFEANNFFALF